MEMTLQDNRHNIVLPFNIKSPQVEFTIYDDSNKIQTGTGFLRVSAIPGYVSLDFVTGDLQGNTVRLPLVRLAEYLGVEGVR